jgi:hypothetical protein
VIVHQAWLMHDFQGGCDQFALSAENQVNRHDPVGEAGLADGSGDSDAAVG